MNRLLPFALLAALMTTARAQHTAIPQSMVFSVGTSARDAGGQDWAFMLWAAPGADLLGGKAFAIYGKAGTANAPSTFAREGIVQGRLDPALIAPLLQRAAQVGQDLAQFDQVIDGIYLGAFYPDVAPALPADRAQRTVIALSKAHTSRNLISQLRTLSMMNPTLALCLGQAWIGPMPVGATKTYELREWNAGSDGAVVGRVTLTGGAPVVLPAAARPVQVPDTTETGDLAVRLRWGVPDELKRRIILHQGYRVWRMSWSQAQALGYDVTPPTLVQLQARVAANQAKLITQQPLFLPSPQSPAQAADLFFEPDRAYLTDDNDKLSDPANYVAPGDGLEVAYIVTPRDVLGRNGQPSLAGHGQFALRKRPPVPRDAAVEIVYGEPDGNGVRPQSFRFTFKENTTDASNPTSGYEIYRGTDVILDGNHQPLPFNFTQLLQHTGTGQREWVEATPPFAPAVQVWFCTRAVRAGPAGMIYSELSPPVYAALQNHEPPAAPQATPAGSLCPQPGIIIASEGNVLNEAVTVNRFFHFRMVCDRLDQQMQWAQFSYVTDEGGADQKTHTLDRIDFAGTDHAQVEFLLTDNDIGNLTRFICTTGDTDDGAHTATTSTLRRPAVMDLNQVYAVQFLTALMSPTDLDTANPVAEYFLDRSRTVVADEVVFTAGTSKGVAHVADVSFAEGYLTERRNGIVWISAGFARRQGGSHMVFTDTTPGAPSTIAEAYRFIALTNLVPCDETRLPNIAATNGGKAARVRLCMYAPAPGSALEYRFYRRVDEGPLVLVAEGRTPTDPNAVLICEEDVGLSVMGGHATYYGQFIGSNGAGSPLAMVKNVHVDPPLLPRPVHAAPITAGDADEPKVRLRWNCPTAGVDRFQITLKRLASSIIAPSVASRFIQVRKNRPSPVNPLLINFVPPEPITSIVTDRIASTQLGEGPAFTLDVEIERDTTYEIWINALSATNKPGPDSAVHTFEWKAPVTIVDAKTPWPFRALPEVVADMFGVANLKEADKVWPAGPSLVGMQIGSLPLSMVGIDNPLSPLDDGKALGFPFDNDTITTRLSLSISRYLFAVPDLGNKTALPAVLYRQQLANDEWPAVSGDVIQVSPLITTILTTNPAPADDNLAFVLRDPFIGIAKVLNTNPLIDTPILDVGLYILDTTPRAVGAKYRYWLVRFDPDTGSPVSVFPATLEEVTP